MAFANPDELAAYTDGLISSNDTRAADILDGATRAIQRIAGWHISPQYEDTVVLDGASVGEILQLPSLYVEELESISCGPRGSVLSVLPGTDYEWSRNGNVRRLHGSCWPYGFGNITVKFLHGFEDVPDLKQIVLQVSAQALSSPTGATREQAGQVSMQWATTAPGVSGGLSLLARDLAVVDSYSLPKRV